VSLVVSDARPPRYVLSLSVDPINPLSAFCILPRPDITVLTLEATLGTMEGGGGGDGAEPRSF
jgi:hypothetical protein